MKSYTGNLSKKLRTLACGGLFACMAMSASADPTITNTDGTFDPFGGFDWNKAGNVLTFGPIVNGGSVTSVFWANAVLLNDTSSMPFATPGLQPTGSAYEYTVYAVMTETVSCGGALGDPCGAFANFTLTGGSWTIYYDTSPDANLVAGTGIQDGDILLTGSVTGGGGVFNLTPGGGIGAFNYQGSVTYTNSTYINPALVSSTATSTLQVGNATTNWTPPSGQPGGGSIVGALAFQADGNQAFTARSVPEPSTLLLLSGALLGLAAVRRKGSTKA